MSYNAIVEKSFDFAVRIVNLAKHLRNGQKEYTLSKQILRCGTSIGANVAEAQRGQSSADFAAKMAISLKEANETQYWLRLLYRTEYIGEKAYKSLSKDLDEILCLLTAICKTATK
ncbi:MAG: four helix bundle protein [Oscillospiraceae bacterium]|nr:four helix bundle protein [Oscillospiraceae bacterium]